MYSSWLSRSEMSRSSDRHISCVGVDVGATNTAAVLLSISTRQVLGAGKDLTTPDVISGIRRAICAAVFDAVDAGHFIGISQVNIGTTQFLNAVVERRGLAKVAVIRLCGPSTDALPPFVDFPVDLAQMIMSSTYLVAGGYQVDGRVITPLDLAEIETCIDKIKESGVKNIAVIGVFSPHKHDQEIQVADLIHRLYPDASVTMSHHIGDIGLLERENATILNESLKPLCARTVQEFRDALNELGLTGPFYLTQNDCTIISSTEVLQRPVATFASRITNSMRGAGYLADKRDAIVIDIGGRTADVGMLVDGLPIKAPKQINVGGVRTNCRMPDVLSIELGGGSLIQTLGDSKVKIGPVSDGHRLASEGHVFGGKTLTATDIAVTSGLAEIGQKSMVTHLPKDMVSVSIDEIHQKLEECIDRVKPSQDPVPVILVGAGSIIVDDTRGFAGAGPVIRPKYFAVANAIGAAVCQLPDTPFTSIPGHITRVIDKDGSDLSVGTLCDTVQLEALNLDAKKERSDVEIPKQTVTSTASEFGAESATSGATFVEPEIDQMTGEWIISEWDLECLAIGVGIKGCGGGGNPYLGKTMALKKIREGKRIRVATPECCMARSDPERDLAVMVAFIGAPTVIIEKIPSNMETPSALSAILDLYNIGGYKNAEVTDMDGIDKIIDTGNVRFIENYQPSRHAPINAETGNKRIVALACVETGGLSTMAPLIVGTTLDLPVLDCDGMGRALPEIQMISPFIYGCPVYPASLSDGKNTRHVVLNANSPKHLEEDFRTHCVEMGSVAGVAFGGLKKEDILERCNPYTISRAWRLGKAVIDARREKRSPVDAILEHENGKLLIPGKITDVHRATTGGFNTDHVTIEGMDNDVGKKMILDVQNENLVAWLCHGDTKQALACVPDLIAVVDRDTGEPIMTEDVRSGLRVAVMVLPCPPLMRTERALEVVGPQAFGYGDDVQYHPVSEYKEYDPIPLKKC